jgi:predicted GNAT family N-acyltransferase
MRSFKLERIEYGGDRYHQAVQLRYRLFYQEHNIPLAAIFDPQEAQDWHLAMLLDRTNQVVAYGRLSQNSATEFQIYQMVVEPTYQGCGLGKSILQALMELAVEQGAEWVILNARVEKAGFYQKHGFQPEGKVFESSMTGIPHIKMQKFLPDKA